MSKSFHSQLIPPRSFSTQTVRLHQLADTQPSQLKPQETTSYFSGRRMVLMCTMAVNYSGTDTNTLSIRRVKKSHAGCYRCLVKNEVKRHREVSEEAELTVCECPSDIVAVVVYYCNLCLYLQSTNADICM